jgi:hypothetical protein
MQSVNTFTESELVTLKDDVEKALLTMRKQLARKKFKIFGKTYYCQSFSLRAE